MTDIIITTKTELTEIVESTVRKILFEQRIPQQEIQDLIPIAGAMEVTNLARQTLYGLVYSRKIPFIKRPGSRKLFFSRKALLLWMQNEPK
ncbi:MAG TPA: helix-turn-helix domain-containing protein [Bacteroidia bacterium]|jgi:hypothetical protein|nr:helix-turn-helix domain-containing protein [Bacteroidia bacterium]